MGALIQGFEYDIFISYRHNDNLDGWVTDFVQNLEKELRSTLKDTLTIYFDKNPHDGLLETHNVDKSLEGKLKCLIFIPIISQTYCDTKSFAWQHEFVAFNNLANEDQFGRDIKLSNGNVASRILPVKIHELDSDDKAIIENEIGGVLRAIEFIYKSGGVNRPLNSKDDEVRMPGKILFRDQVNKVANAIKEIVNALKHNQNTPATLPPLPTQKKTRNVKSLTLNLLILAMVLVIGYFAYLKFNNPTEQSTEETDKSVAVLAFTDLSEQGNLEYLGDGVAEEIINVLAQSKDLKVIARSSSFQFKGKNEDLREIGRKLGVSTILEGSVRKFKDQIRVTAQLIKVSDGSHYWSKNMDQKTENLFEIQDAIAKEVAGFLKATLLEGVSSKEDEVWNEEARRLYQKGRFFFDRSDDDKRALEYFQKSVNIDSSHAISLTFLSLSYGQVQNYNRRDHYLLKAKMVNSTLPELHATQSLKAIVNLDFKEAADELRQVWVKGKSNPVVLRTAAYFCWLSGRPKKAVEFARLALQIDPLIGRSHLGLIQALWADGDYIELLKTSQKAIELFPESQLFRFWYVQALAFNNQMDTAFTALKHVDDRELTKAALTNIYYNQKDLEKLDSLSDAWPADKRDLADTAERLVIKNKWEEAIALLTNAKMDFDLLASLRWSPILKSLSGDKRFDTLIKKYNFDLELPLN